MGGRQRTRRRWSREEKRRIVAQTLIPGVSASQVARRYDVNTNLVFTWRHDPRLRPTTMQEPEPSFLPVEVVPSPVPDRAASDATVEVALSNGHRVFTTSPHGLALVVHSVYR